MNVFSAKSSFLVLLGKTSRSNRKRRADRIGAKRTNRAMFRKQIVEQLEDRRVLAAVSIGTTAYIQNFDTLVSSGASPSIVGGELTGDLNGWYF